MSKPGSDPNSKRKTDVILIIIGVLLPLAAFLLADTYTTPHSTYRVYSIREAIYNFPRLTLLDIPVPMITVLGLVPLGTGAGLILLNPYKPEPPPEPPKES